MGSSADVECHDGLETVGLTFIRMVVAAALCTLFPSAITIKSRTCDQ